MRRVLALVVASALVASSATVSLLHVHEYLEHDHPDHHHGPAAHQHVLVAAPGHHAHRTAQGDGSTIDATPTDDPGRHAVSISSAAACVQRVHIDLAIGPCPGLLDALDPVWTSIAPTDIRLHGPPAPPRARPRAPPLSHLA